MKMVKSLILSSAAGLVAVGGAQAADLPVKAKAVEYVKICSLYGAGFYYIPGTDTCLKIGGYLRVDVLENTNSDASGNIANSTSGYGGAQNRYTDGYLWRSRADVNFDTRTATEYGVVRTFADMVFSWTDDSYGGNGAGATVYSPIGVAPYGSAPANANAGATSGGTLGAYQVFIQFAGFTIGKAISPFDSPWSNYPANNYDGLVGGSGTVTGVNQFTYTAQFGGGVSASIAAVDQVTYLQAGVNNLSAGAYSTTSTNGSAGTTALAGAYGGTDTANTIAPDIVATVKVDQAWGIFQLSAAAHDNHAAYYGGYSGLLNGGASTTANPNGGGTTYANSELAGHPDDKWGYAVQAALQIKNIPTGAGDTFNIQGIYTNGATRYNFQNLSQASGIAVYNQHSSTGYQSVAIAAAPDSVFATFGQQQLITTYGFNAGFNHNWNPFWSTSVYGAYAAVRYNSTAKTLICGNGTTGAGGSFLSFYTTAVLTTCNPDYNIGQAGMIVRWTPVKNLTFSADATYTHIDQKYAGVINASASLIGKPSVLGYQLTNQDTFTGLLRAQRNF